MNEKRRVIIVDTKYTQRESIQFASRAVRSFDVVDIKKNLKEKINKMAVFETENFIDI